MDGYNLICVVCEDFKNCDGSSKMCHKFKKRCDMCEYLKITPLATPREVYDKCPICGREIKYKFVKR